METIERTPLYKYRYAFFSFAALFSLTIPFIKINGNALFRLSFLHRKLEFLGQSFNTSQLYLIPFMIFMFAGFILLVTSLGGRIWCGWGCPQTMFRFVYRDLIQSFLLKLREPKNKNKKLKLNTFSLKVRFVLGVLIYTFIAFLGTANLLWYFIEPNEFFNVVLQSPKDYPFVMSFWFGLSLFFVIDITIIKENFCKYICPYARIQSVFFDKDTALVVYDEKRGNNTDGSQGMKNFFGERDKSGDCTDCQACVKVCPTGIDIRNGLQLGCIECLECIDACYPIMARKNKENLVNWTSVAAMEGKKPRQIRPRTIFYGVIIAVSFIILMSLSFSRSDILLNINRAGELYRIKADTVENYYVTLISNNTHHDKQINFQVKAPFPVDIRRGGDKFHLFSDGKIKHTLVLSSPVANSYSSNEPMDSVNIEIQVIDANNPEIILNTSTAVFFIPKKEQSSVIKTK